MRLLVMAVLGAAMAVPAQDEQAEMIARREKKLESRFLTKADWILDYDEAKRIAKQEGKLIFTYFSRSYAP